MNLFFAEFIDRKAFLNQEESHHLNKVLRLQIGEKVLVTDGKGKMYEGEIKISHQKKSEIQLIKEIEVPEKKYKIHVAMAPTKSNDRTEFFLEKATELGLNEYTPIISFHSERRNVNINRYEKVVLSATKQSLKPFLPKINSAISFADFLENSSGKILIAHCHENIEKQEIKEILKPNEKYTILIGPEGDFSEQEVFSAIEKGAIPISLGSERMRTETAAIYAVSVIHFVNN